MRIVSLDSIKGDELLAKDIMNDNGVVLMVAGSVVKKEYTNRLKDLGIKYIYAEDELSKGINLKSSLEIQIKEQCVETVKDIILRYTYQNISELEEIKKVADEIINDILLEPQIIYNLASIRDKSESTYSHSLNVCALAVIIAIKMKIHKSRIKDIAVGCLLHDIGLIYVKLDYYKLQLESCTENEQKEIKMHTIYGYSAVENMEWLSPVAKDIIISHHERLDGSGYPFHITNDRFKIWSKIVAVCDEFDSKVYGNLTVKMKVHDAIDYIVSQAGILYDISVVRIFVNSVAAYPIGTIVITNQEEVGIVLRQNQQCPTRPIIRIIKSKDGSKPKQWIEKDLTKELTLFITDTILNYDSCQ